MRERRSNAMGLGGPFQRDVSAIQPGVEIDPFGQGELRPEIRRAVAALGGRARVEVPEKEKATRGTSARARSEPVVAIHGGPAVAVLSIERLYVRGDLQAPVLILVAHQQRLPGSRRVQGHFPIDARERKVLGDRGVLPLQDIEVCERLSARPGTPVDEVAVRPKPQRERFEIRVDRALDRDLFQRIVGRERGSGEKADQKENEESRPGERPHRGGTIAESSGRDRRRTKA